MLAVAVAVVGVVMFGIVFLESGANTGEVRLEVEDAYAPGEATFLPTENIFLVRLPGGDFIAVSDLDAANRASQGSRCRVALVPAESANAADLVSRMSPEAAGALDVFRETCFGTIYDLAGIRIDGDGRNLDRHPVEVGADGHVRIDTSERTCSVRRANSLSAPVTC